MDFKALGLWKGRSGPRCRQKISLGIFVGERKAFLPILSVETRPIVFQLLTLKNPSHFMNFRKHRSTRKVAKARSGRAGRDHNR